MDRTRSSIQCLGPPRLRSPSPGGSSISDTRGGAGTPTGWPMHAHQWLSGAAVARLPNGPLAGRRDREAPKIPARILLTVRLRLQ